MRSRVDGDTWGLVRFLGQTLAGGLLKNVEDARLEAWCNAVQMEPFFLGSQLIERCKSEQKECQNESTGSKIHVQHSILEVPSSHTQPG